MALDYTQFQPQVEEFNKKYGVNFSFNTFKNNAYAALVLEQIDHQNLAYKMTVKDLYRKLAISAISKNTKPTFNNEMLKDFEEMLMKPFRTAAQAEDLDFPIEYAGMSELEGYRLIHETISNVPRSVTELYKSDYKNGRLSISQMRSFTESLSADDLTAQDAITAIRHANALKMTHRERSFWWKLFHPFRSNAESRDSAFIVTRLKDLIGQAKLNGQIAMNYNELSKLANQEHNALDNSLSEIENKIRELTGEKKQDEPKQKIEAPVQKDPEPLPENKHLANKNLMKIGFRPSIDNLEAEEKELEALRNATYNHGWSKTGDTTFEENFYDLISENHFRCVQISTTLSDEGIKAATQKIEDSETKWSIFDKAFRNKFNNKYEAPDILLDNDPNEVLPDKIPISVDLKEPIIETQSQKVPSTNQIKTNVKDNV